MPIVLEVCVDSVESALAAQEGNADCLELCSALREGGITPSSGLIRRVRSAVALELHILVRPRSGDFCYSTHEFEVMREDVLRARDLGANGVVVGVLSARREVDVDRTRALVEAARPMQVTFNRAFDVSGNLERSLEAVIAAGADRVLTSGGQRLGIQGTAAIARLVQSASDRIRILGGGGIRFGNVREFVRATGVAEIHTSLRSRAKTPVSPNGAGGILGSPGDDLTQYVISEKDVQRVRRLLDEIAAERADAAFVQ